MKSKFIALAEDLIEIIELNNGKKLYLTRHSKARIKSRNIPKNYIVETFINSDIILPNKDYENAKNYIKIFKGQKLKIGIKDDDEPYVVITAFIQ